MPFRPALLPIVVALLSTSASAQDRQPARSGSPTAALLQSPSPDCLESVSKALRKLSSHLTAQDIPADLFTKSPVATLRVEAGGKPRVLEFKLWIDHYEKLCRVTMTGWASGLVPGCPCVHEDPVAAKEPYGLHLRQLVEAGRVKALEQGCAKSAHPLAAQAAEYRKANGRYVDFKIRLPALMEKTKRKPGMQERNDATDFTLAKADLERGVVSEKAYQDQLKELRGVTGAGLDTACQGAKNLLTEKMMGMVMEMKTFETLNGVTIE